MPRLFLFAVLILFQLSAFSQDYSNKGKDFWIAYGNHVRMFENITAGNQAEKMQLYMTSDVNTTGTLQIPGINLTASFTITANQITTLDIPRSAALLDEGTYNLGIHITAQNPIVVYSFIYVNAISGATLCLPVNTLGREYYSINYTQISNSKDSYSYFDVIATDTGITTVEIIPAQDTKGGHIAGKPYSVSLTQGQTYQALGVLTANNTAPYRGVDLTGTQIRSISSSTTKCKKIAVFCGSGKISIGCGSSAGTSDNLYQQMYPVSTWGKTYITVPTINKGAGNQYNPNQTNYYRIFKSDVTATVKLNGTVLPAANFTNNQYYEFYGKEANYIESDKPVLVAQYLTTGTCAGNTGNGDPEMIYLNPVEQTISQVTLNSMQPAANTNINEHYVNVVCKNTPGATGTFRIDGVGAGNFTALAANSTYAYAQIPVKSGTHTLSCDSGFNAISYGFGNAESYGYSAGTNLKDLYQFVSIQNEYAVVNFPAGCKGSPFKFSIIFPYQPVSIKWAFKGLFADTTVFNPVYDSSWIVNGKTLYRYKLNRSYVINNTATYPITIIADNPTSDGCSGEQQIDYDVRIFDKPSAAFYTAQAACSNGPVTFKDSTNTNGRQLIRWLWNFGDGSAATVNNPTHAFNKAGTYTVSYAVITDIGCLSDTAKQTLTLTEPPVAAFTAGTVLCEKKAVSFSDQSSPVNSLAKWAWNFGDGAASTLKSPSHTYAAAGKYTVTLDITTLNGCISTASVPVTINASPVPNFSIPEVCLADLFAGFNDSTTIADHSESQLQYLWNFGDANANAANPGTSAVKNPKHTYQATGNYDITLHVTSKDGCVGDTTRRLTVNGSTPVADFEVSNADKLCSNTKVGILNRSSVKPGTITRVEVYWDYTNDPLSKLTDEEPSPGKLYEHAYTGFGTPDAKTFTVLFVAYSGTVCMQQISKTITVHVSPAVVFSPLSPVCAEIAPYQITAAKETYGLAGTGTFTGDGVSASGLFSPKAARAGTHTIRYDYTTLNGCTAFQEQTILVNPAPLANAGPDRTLLEGGSVVLAATASPDCVYLWTPANGIENNRVLTPKIVTAEDITYHLQVTSADGCTSGDDVTVKVLKDVRIPNAFTPNGDGVNDTWSILYLNSYPGASVDVYNRYGQQVYHSVGYNNEWDGTYNGLSLPAGTYYWIIDPKNGRNRRQGSVTIIR